MSLRDTLLQLGYVLVIVGAIFATWVVLTELRERFARHDADRASATLRRGPDPEDDQ